jgi:hypothetical protein
MNLTIKNNPAFVQDCEKFKEIIESAKDEQEKLYNQKLYERFLKIATELDNSVEELATSVLDYEKHGEIRDRLLAIKRELHERFTEQKRNL